MEVLYLGYRIRSNGRLRRYLILKTETAGGFLSAVFENFKLVKWIAKW